MEKGGERIMYLTQKLADYVAGLRYEEIPEAAKTAAKRCVLDALANMIYGRYTDTGIKALEYIRKYSDSSTKSVEMASVFDFGEVPLDSALLANTVMARCADLDDGSRRAMGHPGCVLVPSSIAAAQAYHKSGEDLLCALIGGYDIYIRVGSSINPTAYRDRGFDSTGLCGAISAAAVFAKLMGESAEQIKDAMGLAALFCGGLTEYQNDGTMGKTLCGAWAAQTGLSAARLAQLGFTGPNAALEGKKAFMQAFSNEPCGDLVLDRLGESFCINEVYFKQGNPEPVLGAKEMFAAAKEMYHDMGATAGKFIDEMLAADAFDVFPRAGKWGGGYCTSLDDYAQPFILANFNGSSGDVDVLTHEAGHALAYYMMLNGDADYELNLGTMSVAEIHSMAMEFFAWKYMRKFFGKRSEDYKYMHLFSSLTFLPYGAQVDEFQEICYDEPELTPSERNKLWSDLDKKYRPYLTANGIPYFERGTRWQYQMHIYENPMYYIDYCLAQSVAHAFLALSLRDYNDAFSKYMSLVSKAGSLPFGELVESVGLPDPLKPGALKQTTAKLAEILQNQG